MLSELNRIPDCQAHVIKAEMETIVDQWLDVSMRTVLETILRLLFKMHFDLVPI